MSQMLALAEAQSNVDELTSNINTIGEELTRTRLAGWEREYLELDRAFFERQLTKALQILVRAELNAVYN
jgi:hypothetical protein